MKTKLSWVELNYLSFFAKVFKKSTVFTHLLTKFEEVLFRMNYKAILHVKSFFLFEKEEEKEKPMRSGPSSSFGKPGEPRMSTGSHGQSNFLNDSDVMTTLSEGTFKIKRAHSIVPEHTTKEKMVGYKKNSLKLHYVINPPSDNDLMVSDQREGKISPKKLKERVENCVTYFLNFLHEIVFTIMKPALIKNCEVELTKAALEAKQRATELYSRILLMRIIFKSPVIWGIIKYSFDFFGLREEAMLLKNYITRKNCTPKDLDIKPDFQLIPPPGFIDIQQPYEDAINLVRDIESTHCLLQKYQQICSVKEQIGACITDFYTQVQQMKPQKKRIMDSDQLLSIYTYVLLTAKNCKLFSDLQLINSFLSRALTGSGSDGYYYTTFSATICYFINEKPEEIPKVRQIMLEELERKFLAAPSKDSGEVFHRFSSDFELGHKAITLEDKPSTHSLLMTPEKAEIMLGRSKEVTEGLIGKNISLENIKKREKLSQSKVGGFALKLKGNPKFKFFPGESHFSVLQSPSIEINSNFYSI